MTKHLSGTELIQAEQKQKAENFASDYWTLCEKYGLQIVQSPLALGEYKKPEPTQNASTN